jgi:hypothetical protein
MFLSAETSVSFVLRLAHWWRSSKIRPAMEQCGGAEAKRIAHGLDASAPDLHTVAGKWPDAVGPLNYRLTSWPILYIAEDGSRTRFLA